MKISVLQMDVGLNSPDKNYEKAKELIKTAVKESPDVLVLPETFNVGFLPSDIDFSKCDVDGARTKKEIGGLAKEYGVNIVAGSVANKKGGNFYNTAYVFNRQGECVFEYDKAHLFSSMDEDKYFKNGEKTGSFLLDNIRCTLLICYDIRFPELIREVTTKETVDYIFIVSEWPEERINTLKTLVMARAIENRAFAVCANGCGTAKGIKHGGNSMIVSPMGDVMSRCFDNEGIAFAQCNAELLKTARKTEVFKDIKR